MALKYYDSRKKYIPFTNSTYEKKGSKWVLKEQSFGLSSRDMLKSHVKSKYGLPFESRYVKTKQDRYMHDYEYDTFTSYSPDAKKKSVLYFDIPAGEKNYAKLRDRHYAYKRRKSMRK